MTTPHHLKFHTSASGYAKVVIYSESASSQNERTSSSMITPMLTPCSCACCIIQPLDCSLILQHTGTVFSQNPLRPAPSRLPPHPFFSCSIFITLTMFPLIAGGGLYDLAPAAELLSCVLANIAHPHIINKMIASPTLYKTKFLLHTIYFSKFFIYSFIL